MKLSSQTLFTGAVFLLGIPAVVFLPIALVAILIKLVWRPEGIGNFTFAVTQWELTLFAALLGILILLAFLGVALVYRQSRRKANINR